MRLTFITVAGAALALSACGEGGAIDDTVKAGLRTKLVTTCTENAQGFLPAAMNIDLDKVCGCTADKVMADKSAKELMSSAPGTVEVLAKGQQCLSELYPNGINVKTGG